MNDSKSIEVRVFAGIREAIGMESIRIASEELGDVKSAGVLKEAIVRFHPELRPLIFASRVAVGNAFVADEDRLESALETGKTIALIPPVSGG
jgi:molybdopterin converting factor small subunit